MRKIFNTRVITAVVSAVGAIISAMLAGCKVYFGEIAAKDFSSEVLPALMSDTSKGSAK